MEIDLNIDNEPNDFRTVPPGTYLCEVAEVRPTVTQAGDPRWSLKLVVVEGEHAGTQAAWDSLVFSTRGRDRVKSVFRAFDIPNEGVVAVEPQDLHGRRALVEVRSTQYVNREGKPTLDNEVPYRGYRAAPDGAGAERSSPGVDEDAGVPF